MRIANSLLSGHGIHGCTQFHTVIEHLRSESIRHFNPCGTPERSNARAVDDVRPAFEKYDPPFTAGVPIEQAIFRYDVETPFQTHEVTPRLVALATESTQCFRAVERTSH